MSRQNKAIIGRHCWNCKYRHADDWYVLEGFCHFYPSLFERQILKGSVCVYYKKNAKTPRDPGLEEKVED